MLDRSFMAGLSSKSRSTLRPNGLRMQSDRFAREIVRILALSDAARSRRLMRNPLGPEAFLSRFISLPQ